MHKHHPEVDTDIATAETKIVGTLTEQPLGAIDRGRVKKSLDIVGSAYSLKYPVKPDEIFAPGFVAH
jgi:NitT/TauT family transport system substrate-binding protein